MAFTISSALLSDFYKFNHIDQYPEGTEYIYSPFTPRSNKYMPKTKGAVVFGIQAFVQRYLIDNFNDTFFNVPKEEAISSYKRMTKYALGKESDATHLEELHDLGYLPIRLRALPEGTLAPIRVPILTIENTHPKFFWLTNFIETKLTSSVWQAITSATIANIYREVLDKHAMKTVGNTDFVDFSGHDFSMRGMSSIETGAMSGAGHLLSFKGTDTVPAILFLEEFYKANIEKEVVGMSIPATEHSVMCSYGNASELELFKHLINDVYPTGPFSVVSDTWDFWKVVGEYLPALKEDIMKRDGKVVIRPDSGNPVDIICGTSTDTLVGYERSLEEKGLIESLWDIFGGTINSQGYKELDTHIGAIYGDSITIERADSICEKLAAKGFASNNVVFGIGAYSYQMNTRDSLSLAIKATAATVNGEERLLFKDPKTDDGTKRSQRGRVIVHHDKLGNIVTSDGFNREEHESLLESVDLMEDVFLDGKLLRSHSLEEVRNNLKASRSKK